MSQNTENIDILLTNPAIYNKNIQYKSNQIITMSPQSMWQLMLQLKDIINLPNQNFIKTLLALRFIKDTLLLGSYNFYILCSIHLLPSIASIFENQNTDNIQIRAKQFIFRNMKIEQKKIKLEDMGHSKSIVLISQEIIYWYNQVIPDNPFSRDHHFKSHFYMNCQRLKNKKMLESYTFFKSEDKQKCIDYYRNKQNKIKQKKQMKQYIKKLVKQKDKQNIQKVILLLRSGDSHIIQFVYENLRKQIRNNQQKGIPLQAFHKVQQISKCGQVQFNTLVKVFIVPQIIKYIFNYKKLQHHLYTKQIHKKQLLQILNTFNQIVLKYKIDNDIFHTILMKTKYWSSKQIRHQQQNYILKSINYNKNQSVQTKYQNNTKEIIQKINQAQYYQLSQNQVLQGYSVHVNHSQYKNHTHSVTSRVQNNSIISRIQSRLKSKLRKKQIRNRQSSNKQSSCRYYPQQYSKSSLSKRDIFNNLSNSRKSSQYFSPLRIKQANNQKSQHKIVSSRKIPNVSQDYSFKEKQLLQLHSKKRSTEINIQKFDSIIKQKTDQINQEIQKSQKITQQKTHKNNDQKYDKNMLSRTNVNDKVLLASSKKKKPNPLKQQQKRVQVKVQPTVKKPKFGFKSQNKSQSQQCYFYSHSGSQSGSITYQEQKIQKNQYSNFSQILDTNKPSTQVRVIENQNYVEFAINPYKNRQKQLNKKKQQLQKNNIEYEFKIKEKNKKIQKMKQKIQKEKQKFTAYQTTLGKAYQNMNQNIDSLLLSSNNNDRPNHRNQQQLVVLKKINNQLFQSIPKKMYKQIIYKKCLLLKNKDIQIGYVNNHQKQNIILYYTFHQQYDSAHIYIQNVQSTGFIFSQQFDVQIRNIPKSKNIKIQIKVFDYNQSLNKNSKLKFMNLVTVLHNQSQYIEQQNIKEYKVQLPYCLYENFIKFNKCLPSSTFRPMYASYWQQCCDQFQKNRKQFLQMVFKKGYWSQQNVYRIDCIFKGKIYKMAIILDNRNFCIQGDTKTNNHIMSVIGSLLIK